MPLAHPRGLDQGTSAGSLVDGESYLYYTEPLPSRTASLSIGSERRWARLQRTARQWGTPELSHCPRCLRESHWLLDSSRTLRGAPGHQP